jgi:NAD(P)H dehydrogenase (quinone)
MNVLLVYCHPCKESFNAAILKVAQRKLADLGHTCKLIDLYHDNFDPVMRAPEWRSYGDSVKNLAPIQDQAEQLSWAEAVVFIYPTWWYGLPAMLKGWLERVLVPGFAFDIPTADRGPAPKLKHIRRLIVLTTCGATPLISWLMGQPGRRASALSVAL